MLSQSLCLNLCAKFPFQLKCSNVYFFSAVLSNSSLTHSASQCYQLVIVISHFKGSIGKRLLFKNKQLLLSFGLSTAQSDHIMHLAL